MTSAQPSAGSGPFAIRNIEPRPQRQDAACNQLYDVIQLAERLGLSGVFEELYLLYGATLVRTLGAPILDFGDIPQQPGSVLSIEEQRRLMHAAANRIGCYDAADTLRYGLHYVAS